MPITRRTTFFIFLIVLYFTSTACQISAGGPVPSYGEIPVSEEAAVELESIMQSVSANPAGDFAFTLTETQLTSYLAMKIQAQTNPIFHDPQIYLRNNQVEVFGQARQSVLDVNARIVLKANIGEDGIPYFSVVSADFGAIPAPQPALDMLSAMIEDVFKFSNFLDDAVAVGITVDHIFIDQGMLTLSGKIR